MVNCSEKIKIYYKHKKSKNLKELDIVYARSTGGDNDKFELPEDWYYWIPTAHHNNLRVMEFIDKFVNFDIFELYVANQYPKLFYFWGHSFEFERNNNWGLLEEICEKLSNKDDIWYATNMEIYEYVQAYNALLFSADGNIVLIQVNISNCKKYRYGKA